MRFLTRGLIGLCLLTLTLGILGLAGGSLVRSIKEYSEASQTPRVAKERVFSVEVAPLELLNHAPVITTFGEVLSGRTLELRAAASGAIVQLSPRFRDGGKVTQGELLFQTDPSNADSKLRIAETELSEAKSDLTDALSDYSLAEAEIEAAKTQLKLREQAMARQKSLKERGVGTEAAMETAALSASSAEQTLLSKRLSRSQAQSRIARAEIAVARKEINLVEAQRVLDDTTVFAEFDGVLSDVSVVLGGLVNANEKVAKLIDPNSLEVAFRVSNSEFGSLMRSETGLRGAALTVSFSALEDDITGQIDRVSAAVGEGQTGRELFAHLGLSGAQILRPGDFVTVAIQEPVLNNVAVIPAKAASASGEVLLVGENNRLEAATVDILRKQGDRLVVRADDIVGRLLVQARAPQLGAGIRIEPRNPGPVLEQDPPELETVEVSDELREQMIAFVTANKRIPADRKKEVLQKLQDPRVPKVMVDRITSRMGG